MVNLQEAIQLEDLRAPDRHPQMSLETPEQDHPVLPDPFLPVDPLRGHLVVQGQRLQVLPAEPKDNIKKSLL